MNHQLIPSDYYSPARTLVKAGFSYSELKLASQTGGDTKAMEKQQNKACLLQIKKLEVIMISARSKKTLEFKQGTLARWNEAPISDNPYDELSAKKQGYKKMDWDSGWNEEDRVRACNS